MIDLSVLIETAMRDPLVVFLGLFALGAVTAHLLLRRYPLGRAIIRVVFLVLLTVALLSADVVPYKPLELTGSPFRDAVRGILKIAWWLGAAWFVVGFVRALVIVEHRPREGKLLQDLFAGLVYLAAVFAIIAYVFDLPVQGLLATSGAIAIILGLALQSTLSDVFSGVVLNFSRPYRPGDWINLEGGTNGRVIEMNWRATHVLTGRHDLAIVPNSTIAKSKIVNVSSPSGIHGTTITVQLDTKASPAIGTEILERALLNCRLIVGSPSPTVSVKSITAAYIEFEITFFVEDLASATQAQNELFDLIFRHLAAVGLGLAFPQNSAFQPTERQNLKHLKTQPETALELVTTFATLTVADRAAIAAKLRQHSYDQGETLLEPGTVLQSLFIVGSGVLSLIRADAEVESEVMRLGPGDHFGEIGMLTGAPSVAKINALTPAVVYELAKTDLAPILEARPEVSQELCRALARRQATGRSTATTEMDRTVPMHRLTSWFSERVRRLYNLANVD
jgi:small-conductance mechanosensitive channel/CRP-like cAMP-binding protein